MKLIKTASGKKTLRISKKEWQSIGKKAGWGEIEDFSPSSNIDLGGSPSGVDIDPNRPSISLEDVEWGQSSVWNGKIIDGYKTLNRGRLTVQEMEYLNTIIPPDLASSHETDEDEKQNIIRERNWNAM